MFEHNYFTGFHTSHWRQPCYRKKFILMTHQQQPRHQRAFLLFKSLLLGWNNYFHDSDIFLHTSCKQGQGQGQRRYSRLLSQPPPASIYFEQDPVLPHMCVQNTVNTNSFAKFSSSLSRASFIYNTVRNPPTGGTLISYSAHLHNFCSHFYSVNTTKAYADVSCAKGI